MIARHAYQTLQSLPLELPRTADVSPSAVTFRGRKLLICFVDGQNRTQEADGSIPFISTILLGFIFLKGRLKRFAGESFQIRRRVGRL